MQLGWRPHESGERQPSRSNRGANSRLGSCAESHDAAGSRRAVCSSSDAPDLLADPPMVQARSTQQSCQRLSPIEGPLLPAEVPDSTENLCYLSHIPNFACSDPARDVPSNPLISLPAKHSSLTPRRTARRTTARLDQRGRVRDTRSVDKVAASLAQDRLAFLSRHVSTGHAPANKKFNWCSAVPGCSQLGAFALSI